MAGDRARQCGLTLTELMVSVAISVALLVVLANVYLGSRAAYRTNEALARLQETGRLALELIARDLRSSGFAGCLSRGGRITVYVNPRPAALDPPAALRGHERAAGFAYPGGVERLAGDDDSDVVRIVAVDSTARAYVDGESDVAAATIAIRDNDAGFEPGDLLVVSDCERAALFAVTGLQSKPLRLAHAADRNGGIDTPTHRISPSFKARDQAFVARFDSVAYFVGRPKGDRQAPPSLYRAGLERTEKVVENVEDLDFLYGLDDDGDGAVDRYLPADRIDAAQWERVLSVRVSLLAVSAEAAPPAGGQVVYLRDVDGDTLLDPQPARDARQLRQVFTTTVSLRNRPTAMRSASRCRTGGAGRHPQRGAVLVVGLVFLLLMTLIGVTAFVVATQEERMAGNARDRLRAFEAAEQALRHCEGHLSGPLPPVFSADGSADSGMYSAPDAGRAPAEKEKWQAIDWDAEPTRQLGGVPDVAEQPRCIAQQLARAPSGNASRRAEAAVVPASAYQVTARGVGAHRRTVVVLQSTFVRD
ncbi:MAG: PilW family protein [Burkholderiales bacterium]|nr:PilW family protein [Burkholderiales bacterium]